MKKDRTPTTEQLLKIQEVANEINEIIKNPACNNVIIIFQIILETFKKIGYSNFYEIENQLRKIESRLYLIAMPVHTFGRNYLSKNSESEELFDYAIRICLYGQEEAEKTLKSVNLTKEENEINLKSCGFLVMCQGTYCL